MGPPLVAPRAGNDDDRDGERMFVRRTRCPVCDSGRLATLIEHLARRAGMTVTPGSFGGRHLDLDVASFPDLARSAGLLGGRVLKDLYVRLGPGARDGGYHLLQRSP